MKRTFWIPMMASALLASPAHAEKLTFDYRIYPPLEQVLNSGRNEMVSFNDRNPRYVTDRIAIQGTSAESWTEALDIIARSKARKMSSPADWAREIQQSARARCASEFTNVAEDANSLTFVRRSTNCPPGTAQTGLYRIVAGRTSLFLLNAIAMGEMAEPVRQKWLELLASAHLSS